MGTFNSLINYAVKCMLTLCSIQSTKGFKNINTANLCLLEYMNLHLAEDKGQTRKAELWPIMPTEIMPKTIIDNDNNKMYIQHTA